jgi:hypothetical protein
MSTPVAGYPHFFVCASRYKTRAALELCDFGIECFPSLSWNGRFLYYTFVPVGGASTGLPQPRLLDLKTGLSSGYLQLPVDAADHEECSAEGSCTRYIYSGFAGAGASFAIVSRIYKNGPDHSAIEFSRPQYVIEGICLNASLTEPIERRVVTQLHAYVDQVSVHVTGAVVHWKVHGKPKSAQVC